MAKLRPETDLWNCCSPAFCHCTLWHAQPRLAAGSVDPDAAIVEKMAKFKYVMPLDEAMRQQLLPQAKPFPKKETASVL